MTLARDDHDPCAVALDFASGLHDKRAELERVAFGHAKRHGARPRLGDDPGYLLDVWRVAMDRTRVLTRLVAILKRVRGLACTAFAVLLARIARMLAEADAELRVRRTRKPLADRPTSLSPPLIVLTCAPPHAPTTTPAPTLAGAATT